ncbi:hypothetical protein GCM10010344_10010 [Streptomyces bluensis]|nr:hypothetical protein GCM10010344_10010 [Streptomyces bluensis]
MQELRRRFGGKLIVNSGFLGGHTTREEALQRIEADQAGTLHVLPPTMSSSASLAGAMATYMPTSQGCHPRACGDTVTYTFAAPRSRSGPCDGRHSRMTSTGSAA